ncbi:MCE family protein [Sciscionella sediminilitoris]|uniref:MCE family protein n=1 Tax=Sciscionella sediminilitoris TaxID=1445613 RepID=UPI0004DEE75F|nr:MCE family protein [Sciscionella sp. SE31]
MKSFSSRNPIPIGITSLVVIVLLVAAALNSDNLPLIGGGTTYTANVREAAGLASGATVRIGGVKAGKVSDVRLDGDHVRVDFRIKDAFIGDKSEVAIKLQTLLGQKYLDVESRGSKARSPGDPMGENTAESIYYDVQDAFNGLADRVSDINTDQLANSLETLSDTFKDTPANVRSSLDGLSRISKTISSRDAQLQQLLNNTKQISTTLASRNQQVEKILGDGSALLSEIQQRKQAIDTLLKMAQQLSKQVDGLIDENDAQLKPVLDKLNQFTGMLKRNQESLGRGMQNLAPFVRVFNNALGNGRWFDAYICGLLLPPSIPGVNGADCSWPHEGDK